MSSEYFPPRDHGLSGDKESNEDLGHWYSLIDEKAAARELGVIDRTMQNYRQRGGGPKFIRLSSRCIRYRRIDLREWVEARLRHSTSDTGAS